MLIIIFGGKIIDDFFPCDFLGRGAFPKVSVVNMQLFYNKDAIKIIKQ